MLEALVTSGRVVDLVLAVLVLESLGLIIFHRVTGSGPRPAAVLALSLPGALLMLALRAALTEASHLWVLGFLVAAFGAHLADLRMRW